MHGSMTHQLAVEKNKRDDASLILRQANLQDCLVWAKEWFKSGTHAKKIFFLLKYKTDVGITHYSKVLVNASLN